MRYLTILFLFATFFAQAQADIDPSLTKQFAQQEQVGFIVLLRDQADLSFVPRYAPKNIKGQLVFEALRQKSQETQGHLLQIIHHAGAPSRPFLLANAVYVKGSQALVNQLSLLSEVKTIMYDSPVVAEKSITVDYINENAVNFRSEIPEWGIRMIKADSAWLLDIKGQGVVIAGQDTGYDWEHPAIKSKYRGNGEVPDHNYNWHDAIHESDPAFPDTEINPCGFNVDHPCADHPHGTHTVGTMVGSAPDNVIGVAPDAQWIGCRNMDRGFGTPASYIECFEFFLAPTDLEGNNPDVTKAPHVINNSWACPESEGCNPDNFEIMNIVINNLKTAGIVVVVSAGNSGSACSTVTTPAAIFANSFSVGATQLLPTTIFQDSISGFSSRGPVAVDGSGRMKPDVAAPGQNIKSCIPNGGYANYSGTSMAGPHVAGAVALIISANPELAGMVDTIEYILETTAVKKQTLQECDGVAGDLVPNNTYGHGRINVYKAVQLAQTIVGNTNLPKPNQIMTIQPNPASTKIGITLDYPKQGQITIYNNLGQIVKRQAVNSTLTTMDVSTLPKGSYFVQFLTDKHQEVQQVIIQ